MNQRVWTKKVSCVHVGYGGVAVKFQYGNKRFVSQGFLCKGWN